MIIADRRLRQSCRDAAVVPSELASRFSSARQGGREKQICCEFPLETIRSIFRELEVIFPRPALISFPEASLRPR